MEEIKVYSKGEYVVYKKSGVFRIDDIRKEKICSEIKSYYLLQSVYDKNASVYVPADNEVLVGMMEQVLTKEEIEAVIEKSKECKIDWPLNSQERQAMFDNLLENKDLSMIICLMKILLCSKEQALSDKIKFPAIDEHALNSCRKMLSEAFAFSLGIDKKDVQQYIMNK